MNRMHNKQNDVDINEINVTVVDTDEGTIVQITRDNETLTQIVSNVIDINRAKRELINVIAHESAA